MKKMKKVKKVKLKSTGLSLRVAFPEHWSDERIVEELANYLKTGTLSPEIMVYLDEK